MSIQCGILPITDVKFCDSQGVIKNIHKVVRDDTLVWETHKTVDNGVWTCKDYYGEGDDAVLYWNEEHEQFRPSPNGYPRIEYYQNDIGWMWHMFPSAFMVAPRTASGDEYSTELTFSPGGRVFTWSES